MSQKLFNIKLIFAQVLHLIMIQTITKRESKNLNKILKIQDKKEKALKCT